MSRAKKRLVKLRASAVRPGDTVHLGRAVFRVQHVYKGGGRLSFITSGGFPVDIDPSLVVLVLR